MPTETQTRVTNACLVAIAEHGLVPSVQAARMTLAAAPEAWQGAMAAGLLGMGSVVAGSSEAAGRYLVALIAEASRDAGLDRGAGRASLQRLEGRRSRRCPASAIRSIPQATRAPIVLLQLADERGVTGRRTSRCSGCSASTPEDDAPAPLPINVSGAIPAVMLDAGWPLEAMKGLPLLARTAGLVAASLRGIRAADRLRHVEPCRSGDRL